MEYNILSFNQYGLRLKFVDIDLKTLNYDLQKLETSINHKTKAIIAVNLLGNPNEFTKIKELVADSDILLLEDNCESLGAKYNDKYAGTFGICGSFSTFFSHHISTMEGGLVVTDDEEIHHILLSLRSHGWTRHLPKINKVTGTKSENYFDESFKFVLPGYNLRPLELSGAIGKVQIRNYLILLMHAGEMQSYLFLYLKIIRTCPFKKRDDSWFGFSFIVKNSSITRQLVLNKLDKIGALSTYCYRKFRSSTCYQVS